MKKKLLAIALCLCTAFSVTACGGSEGNGEENTEKTEGKITLGEYKGIKVDASLQNVTDEDLDYYLNSVLETKATEEEITEGTVAKDDEVKVDCTIYVDGKEYNAMTGERLVLEAEAGTVSEGFPVGDLCAGIVGKNIGDEFELKLKYGDKYADTTVAGKDATFKIKLISKINTIVPEFTDEFVSTYFDYIDLATKDDLLEYLKRDLRINQVYNDIWESVVLESATVDSYDSDDLAEMTQEYAYYQEYYISQMTGGYTLDQYLTAIGQTEEAFMEQMEEAAKVYLKQEMLIKAIAEAENITITDEIYAQEMLEFAKSYGYDTAAEFEEAYSDSMTKEDFEFTILTYLVEELVCESVEFVEGYGFHTEEETAGEDSTGEETTGEETTGEDTTGEETTAATE